MFNLFFKKRSDKINQNSFSNSNNISFNNPEIIPVFKSRLERLEKIEKAFNNFRWTANKTSNPAQILEAATKMICEAYDVSESDLEKASKNG